MTWKGIRIESTWLSQLLRRQKRPPVAQVDQKTGGRDSLERFNRLTLAGRQSPDADPDGDDWYKTIANDCHHWIGQTTFQYPFCGTGVPGKISARLHTRNGNTTFRNSTRAVYRFSPSRRFWLLSDQQTIVDEYIKASLSTATAPFIKAHVLCRPRRSVFNAPTAPKINLSVDALP
jgi:hypothetical protein